MAHRFAIGSEHIRADMVEISEFPHLAQKYTVHGVPKTVINDRFEFVGALPEAAVLEQIMSVVED